MINHWNSSELAHSWPHFQHIHKDRWKEMVRFLVLPHQSGLWVFSAQLRKKNQSAAIQQSADWAKSTTVVYIHEYSNSSQKIPRVKVKSDKLTQSQNSKDTVDGWEILHQMMVSMPI